MFVKQMTNQASDSSKGIDSIYMYIRMEQLNYDLKAWHI